MAETAHQESRPPHATADDDRSPSGHLGAMRKRLKHSAAAVFVRRFVADDILSLAGALSFFSLLSLAPLVLMLLWLTTTLYPAAQEEFFRQIGLLIGSQVENTARTIVENAQREPGASSIAGLLGTLALLFGASVVFGQLQVALNRVFSCDTKQVKGGLAWLRKRLLSFGMVVTLGFLLVVSMVVQAALQLLADLVPRLLPVFVSAASFGLYGVMFAMMYRWLPDRPVNWRRALLGGALTAAMFMLGRWAIGLYLGRAATGSVYGPAGGLVLMLMWMYYSAVVFLAGALITAMLDERATRRRRAAQTSAVAGSPAP